MKFFGASVAWALLISGAQAQKCGNHEQASEAAQFQQKRALSLRRSRPDHRVTSAQVPVCFFVLTPTSGAWDLTDAQLQGQLDALNVAYSDTSCCDSSQGWCNPNTCSIDTGISFRMATVDGSGDVVDGVVVDSVTDANACVVRITNNAYATSSGPGYASDNNMKRALRKGGPDVLNVYMTDFDGGILGYAAFPWEAMGDTLALDGIINRYSTVPGGSAGDGLFGEGDTLVHEVGHWMGLFHTFQGECSVSDGVTDTAPEYSPYSGCSPWSRPDTCNDNQGPDPIFNFMDYSDDLCLYEFTDGQKEIMLASWDIFRLGNGSAPRATIPLTLGQTADPLYMDPGEKQVYSVDISSLGEGERVVCTSDSAESDIDMFMRLDASPLFGSGDCCISENEGNEEACTAGTPGSSRNSQTFLSNLVNLFRRIFQWLFSFGNDDVDCDATGASTLYVGVLGFFGYVVDGATIRCYIE